MANQQIVDYIKAQKAQGYAPGQSKAALVQQGWPEKDVDEAIKAVSAPGAQPSAARPAGPAQTAPAEGIKKRNPFLVLLFSLITIGIYGMYWLVSTTKELRRNTKSAPNPWLLLLLVLPGVNFIIALYYYWKYSKAINELTGFSAPLLFVLWLIIAPVAMVLAQMELNKKAA